MIGSEKYCLVYREKHGDHVLWGAVWENKYIIDQVPLGSDPVKYLLDIVLKDQKIKRKLEPVSLTLIENAGWTVPPDVWSKGLKEDSDHLIMLNNSFDNSVE